MAEASIARSHLLRRGRVSLTGQVYLVTTRTAARAPRLADFTAARAAIGVLRDIARQGHAVTLAFVVMPDHVHWLLQPAGATLSESVRRFKGAAARAINLCDGRSGPFWQPGFHDHALRRDENLVNCARYLLMNPVRAGLARDPGEWPHWWVNMEDWPLLVADLGV